MAEYIERDKVIKMAETNKAVCLCEADIVDIRSLVNCVPAADVRSERYGEWKENGGNFAPNERGEFEYFTECSCSACGWGVSCKAPLGFAYCPNCGAKMDGKDGENNG